MQSERVFSNQQNIIQSMEDDLTNFNKIIACMHVCFLSNSPEISRIKIIFFAKLQLVWMKLGYFSLYVTKALETSLVKKKNQWRSEVGKSSNTCKFLLLSNMIIRSYCKLFHYLWTGRTKIRNYFTQPKQIRSTLFLRYMNEKHLIIQDFLLLFVYVLLPHRRQKEGTRISSLPQSGHVRQLKTNEISISTVHTRCKIRHSDLVSSFKYLNKVN